MIKCIAMAASLAVFSFFSTGCTMVKSSVVNQGATQYPREIKPLIFVNFSTGSELNYLFSGKIPLKISGFLIENEKTHELTGFTLQWNPFLSGSRASPFKISDQSNTVNTPVLITLNPGNYILKNVDISSAGAENAYAMGLDFDGPALRFNVPDKDFCSLGTVAIEIKEKRGMDVGNVLQGYKLDCSERHAFLRTISPPEEDFAVKAYPFLKDLNLAPYIKLAPNNNHP
jgi:hypothetical protein